MDAHEVWINILITLTFSQELVKLIICYNFIFKYNMRTNSNLSSKFS